MGCSRPMLFNNSSNGLMSDLTSSYTHQSSPKDTESVFLIKKKEEQLKLGSKKNMLLLIKKNFEKRLISKSEKPKAPTKSIRN